MKNNNKKPFSNVLILADSFEPELTSTARHMTDLVNALTRKGYSCTVVTSVGSPSFENSSTHIDLVAIKNPFKRSNRLVLRVICEILFPIILLLKFYFCIPFNRKYEFTIIWSPNIFWTLFLLGCSRQRHGYVRLIVRDLFPLWLEKTGVLSSAGLPFKVLNFVARLQFWKADKIYVQSLHDQKTLCDEYGVKKNKFALLGSWYAKSGYVSLPRNLVNILKRPGYKVLLLGTFGVAQDCDYLTDVLRAFLSTHINATFILVGIKSHDLQIFSDKLKHFEDTGKIIVIPGLSHDEVSSLCKECDLGIASLASSNTSGNVPGKFLCYTMSGLPTFAISPQEFELSRLISSSGLGAIGKTGDINICVKQLADCLKMNFDRLEIQKFGNDYCSVDTAVMKLTEGI